MDIEGVKTSDTTLEFGHKHYTAESASRLEPTNIHRIAYEFSSLLADIPVSFGQAKPLIVGSYVTNPDTAQDLDFEVYGATWDEVQDFFKTHGPELIQNGAIKSFFLTRALEDGTIPQDRYDEGYGGNAFFAVRVVHSSGSRIDVTLPCTVNAETNRYQLHSVHRDPNLTPLEASRRRNFAHNSLLLDMLGGSINDPHDGIEAIKERKLIILDPAYKNDPVGLWAAIMEMGNKQYSPDENSRALLIEMAKEEIDYSDTQKVDPERLQYERSRVFFGSLAPSIYLKIAKELSAFETQIPALHALTDNVFSSVLLKADFAWADANSRPEPDVTKKIAVVVAAIAFEVIKDLSEKERIGNAIQQIFTAFNWRESKEKESIYSLALKELEFMR